MPQTSQYWLDRAEAARAKAEEFRDPECRQIMLDVAKAYERLARCRENDGSTEIDQDKPVIG